MSKPEARTGLRVGASILALALSLAAGMLAPAAARAQNTPTVDTSQPIVVRSRSKSKIKFAQFSGQILSVDKEAIEVRANGGYDVRKFAYTPKVSAKVARGIAKGRYRQGKPVQIKYAPGSNVAAGIRR